MESVPQRKRITWEDKNGCWICTSHRQSRHGKGSPQMMIAGKVITVARYVYEQFTGKPISNNMIIKHSCNNPLCINPNHVILEQKPSVE